jgi:glycolate oxidase FAD binding subunit
MTALTPTRDDEIIEAIHLARQERASIAIEGSGTKTTMGRPMQAKRVLSTRALSGITLYEPAELVLSAKSGTPLAEVEAALRGSGQMLPFEPMDYRPLLGSTGEQTIGGMTASHLSGPRRIMSGSCRDSLIGARFINGRGEVVKSGGRVMKNVTGLDLARTMAGSWGTLGVLTEVTFKLVPRPESTLSLVFHGLDDAQAVALMSKALGSPFEVSGAAHLPVGIDRIAMTLLRLEGFAASLAYRSDRLKHLLAEFGRGDTLDDTASTQLWSQIRDMRWFAEPRQDAVWRISVPPSKAPAMLAKISAHRRIRHLLDWGGGLVWISTSANDLAGSAVIRPAVQEAKGHALLVRASEGTRGMDGTFEPQSPTVLALSAGLKKSFDPDHVLNPGRMYSGI